MLRHTAARLVLAACFGPAALCASFVLLWLGGPSLETMTPPSVLWLLSSFALPLYAAVKLTIWLADVDGSRPEDSE